VARTTGGPTATATPGDAAQGTPTATPVTPEPTKTGTPAAQPTGTGTPTPGPTTTSTPTATPTDEPTPTPTPEPEPPEIWDGENRLTLLVLGIDQADEFYGNTDVMMLISLDPSTESVFMLSIPRDLCLGPCDGHSSRINEVYKRQGIDELKRTIHNLTGIRVNNWVMLNFYGVERVINELGGVRIWSSREFDERFVYLDTDEEIRLILEPGWNTLNGREAVGYARSRKYDYQGDFARICRQQQVVRGLRDQALSPMLLINAPAVLASLDGAFRTDFPLDRVVALGELVLRIPPERIHSWTVHKRDEELLRPLTGEDGANLLQPDIDAIRDFVQSALILSTQDHTDSEGNPAYVRDNCEEFY
jgi:LCP family protein required for cell wall assembly